jgi:hypothetical protein
MQGFAAHKCARLDGAWRTGSQFGYFFDGSPVGSAPLMCFLVSGLYFRWRFAFGCGLASSPGLASDDGASRASVSGLFRYWTVGDMRRFDGSRGASLFSQALVGEC